MNLLLKSVHVISPGNPDHNKKCDIYIENGIYKKIGASIDEAECSKDTIVKKAEGLYISAGWIDMRCRFGEPGHEQKETIASGLAAAAAGGFTGVVLMPSTQPPLYNRSAIEYIKKAGAGSLTDIWPAGCITEKREGKELAEMYDMQLGGAVAFTDDQRVIKESGLMLRVMQYAGNINAPVISYADDRSISGDLQANQSAATTLLGFKGSPAIAEVIAINRDIQLCRYSGIPVHFSGVSTAAAVEAIRNAKKEGLPVTAEVNSYHLLLDDSMLESFDTQFKTRPPLRTRLDVEALIKAVADDTIDVIVSDHTPEDKESKEVEWDYAAHGMVNLETSFSVMLMALKNSISLDKMIQKITVNPRRILSLPGAGIKSGAKAEFTLFNPEAEWQFNAAKSHSLSSNSPFEGRKLTGKVIATGNNNQVKFFE